MTTAVFNTKLKKLRAYYQLLVVKSRKNITRLKCQTLRKKYFTTSDNNKFASQILDAEIKEKELVNKSNISNLVKLNSNFTKVKTKFSLSLHYNHDNSYLFANGKEIIGLKPLMG